jgi:phosphoribosylformylglycinamidine (FGAM) synthase PurS component
MGYDIYGTRVAPDGTVLDPAGIAVSTAAKSQYFPSVASNGTDYFVAWEDWRSGTTDIYGARVASDGTVLDPAGIAVSTEASGENYPSVASNGTDYFVTWVDFRNWPRDIYGARVTSAGTVLDPAGIPVSTAASDQWDPSVASNGTDYFVAWGDSRNGPSNRDIYGTRVTSAGTVLDPAGIAVSTAASGQAHPSVASNGTDYFNMAMEGDIYGARVAPDGTVLDPAGIALSTAANDQRYPSVASNGTDYFVVWDDYRSGPNHDVYGARVTWDGTVLDAAGLLIHQKQSFYYDFFPAVAYSACGKYLVTYFRFPEFGAYRVMARLFYDGLVPSCIVEEVSATGSTNSLMVEGLGSGQVKIRWENRGDIMQYNIYEGDLDAPLYNHFPLVCWTAGTDEGDGYLSEIITPVAPNAYYLVTVCDTATEGTPGYDSAGVERDNPLGTCGPHP